MEGLFVATPSPALVEMVGAAGYDVAILDAPSYTHLVYRPGVPLVAATLVGGKVAWSDQSAGLTER